MNGLHKVEQLLLTKDRYEEVNQTLLCALYYEKQVTLTYKDDVFVYKTDLPLYLLVHVEFL